VGDSATVTSPLIPWDSCGAFMAATLGVPTLSFAGFAFFSIINPLTTILIAFLGIRMLRLPGRGPDHLGSTGAATPREPIAPPA
jgi:NhaC family Na+:H+ antiporter